MGEEASLLEQVFSFADEVPEAGAVAVEEVPEVTPATTEEPVAADDTQDTEEKGEDTPAPPAEEEPKTIPYAALKSERTKRQEYEKQLAEARTELERIKSAAERKEAPPAPEPVPDFDADPRAHFDARFAALEQRQNALIQQHKEERLLITAKMAHERHADFEPVLAQFFEKAKDNPLLLEQMQNSADPGEFVYQTGKRIAEAKMFGGDQEKLITARVAEERKKWEAEQSGRSTEDALAALPQSQAGKPSKGGAPIKKPSNPMNLLEEALKR